MFVVLFTIIRKSETAHLLHSDLKRPKRLLPTLFFFPTPLVIIGS